MLDAQDALPLPVVFAVVPKLLATVPRWLRRTLIGAGTAIVLFLGAAFTLATVYEDDVKAALLAELNKHLVAPVTHQGIDLTLVQQFPQASLRFKRVLVAPVGETGATDTLLFAEDLFFSFSLWDLFAGDYAVDRVTGKRVVLHPGYNEQGAENWMIWKSDSTSEGPSNFALNEVAFDGLSVRYRDARRALEVSTESRNMVLSGLFDGEGATVRMKGDAWLRHLLTNNGSTFADHQSDLDLVMELGRPEAAFRITQGKVMAGNVPLDLSLTVAKADTSHVIDLSVLGADAQLKELITQLPPAVRNVLKSYAIAGEADIALRYKGTLAGNGPDLELTAVLRDASMKEQSTGTRFNKISGEVEAVLASDGSPKRLVVKDLSARSGSGTLRADLRVNGTRNAPVRLDLRTDMALADLLHFARIDTVAKATGRVKATLHANGKLRDVGNLRAADLRALTFSGNAELQKSTLKLRTVRHPFEDMSGTVALKGNDATLSNGRATVQGSTISMTGTLGNLMPYLFFDDQPLNITATASAPHVDLARLFAASEKKTKGNGDITLPALINLDLRTTVDDLVFADFRATGIKGHLTLKDRVLKATDVSCSTARGTVTADLSLDGRQVRSFPLAVNATLKDIDVKELFREFQDFGQTFMGHRHLKGTADVRVSLTAPLTASLHLDEKKLACVADLTVRDGALVQHEALIDVAKHIRSNKLIAPLVDTDELGKRLANVTFNTLTNTISIRDGAVHVPAMVVKNNVLEIEMSGKHAFDNTIDHHLSFRLNKLLALDGEADAFGPVEDDGTGLRVFLHMYGNSNDPQFANDRAMASAHRKARRQEEGAELKQLLREEFTGKTSDPVVRKSTAGTPLFTTQWAQDSVHTTEAVAPVQRKKGLGRLFKEEEEEKETFNVE